MPAPRLATALSTPPPAPVGPAWWARADALAQCDGSLPLSGRYRLGDGLLEVATDFEPLLRTLDEHYGACAVPRAADATLPTVRCSVRSVEAGRLALVDFAQAAEVDAFEAALALLQHPAADPAFLDAAGQVDGWRLIKDAASGAPVTAARGSQLLVEWQSTPAPFLVQFIINPVLAAQRGMLFAHAASIGVRGSGLLLVGPSGSGKTTASLTLASRGHAFYGDDIAAIRVETTELLAFWRTAHVRPGPHARALGQHLEAGQWDPPYRDGKPRLRMRVADVFPAAAARSVPLRCVLFLRGFAAEPRIEFFAPTAQSFGAASPFALNNTLWVAWGTTPPRRLMQFMLFLRMLERVRCGWLDAGDPEATADLIETTLEGEQE